MHSPYIRLYMRYMQQIIIYDDFVLCVMCVHIIWVAPLFSSRFNNWFTRTRMVNPWIMTHTPLPILSDQTICITHALSIISFFDLSSSGVMRLIYVAFHHHVIIKQDVLPNDCSPLWCKNRASWNHLVAFVHHGLFHGNDETHLSHRMVP